MWGIGVDADQRYLGAHMLTSALKKVDMAVVIITKRAMAGNLKGQATSSTTSRTAGSGSAPSSKKVVEGGPREGRTRSRGRSAKGQIKVKQTVKF